MRARLRPAAIAVVSAVIAATASIGVAAAASADPVADAVLGQQSFTGGQCDDPAVSASTMCVPIEATVDPTSGRLYVAEEHNNRVTSWPSAAAFVTGQAADLEIGQPSFTSRLRCRDLGVGASTTCQPADMVVDGAGNLFLADRNNHRVLEYNSPATTDTVADRVFGQPSFTTNDCPSGSPTASSLCQPRGVALDSRGNLYVADQKDHRVLMYADPLTGDPAADLVLGQPDFTTKDQGTSSTMMSEPRGLGMDATDHLYVADAFNNRVLMFTDPVATDAVADKVFGQSSFATKACNAGGISARSLCNPKDIAPVPNGTVWIADSINSRVLGYLDPLATDTKADRVIGQLTFRTKECNQGGLSATSMCVPRGLAADLAGNVYVPDSSNNRVLRFDAPVP